MKTRRNIIIAAVIIALLAVGIIVLMQIDTDKTEPQTERSMTYTVYPEEASDLSEVEVKTADMEIKAVNKGKSEWTINDLDIGEVDPSKAYNLAGTISGLTSKNMYEKPDDLSQYGLDDPDITVNITKKSGEKDVLYIGDMSPSLGEYFVRREGDDNVYTMYAFKVDTLLKPAQYYMEFNRFDVNADDITGIKIERAGKVIEIKLLDVIDENTNNVWEMISPYECGANDDYIDNRILDPIDSITFSTPSDNDGGFDESSPSVTLVIVPYDTSQGKYGKEYTETFTVGRTEGNITYVRYKDNVYQTEKESVAFAFDSEFNIVSKLQALVDISLVKSVSVEYGNESHVMEIKKDDNNKYTFKIDGTDTDSAETQEIYRNMIGLAVDAVYDGAAAGDTILKLSYEGIKSEDDTVVEIKQLDEINCLMERDGKKEFTIKKSKADDFIELFDAYVKAVSKIKGR